VILPIKPPELWNDSAIARSNAKPWFPSGFRWLKQDVTVVLVCLTPPSSKVSR